jgi:hypothetical protein
MHLEAQAVGNVYNSRFITNTAESGGAITLYLASLTVEKGIFLGNRAVGVAKGGYGGAISGNSNDTPSDGSTNRPPSSLTVQNSYFQGRYNDVTTVAMGGGAIFMAGDYNRQNGTGGVSKMGGVAENRAPLSISNSAFVDLDVSKSDNGNGGAIYVGLADLNLIDSMVVKSDTNGTYGSGGAVMLIAQARGQVANSIFAKNTSSNFGGAFHSDGAELNITGCKLIENTAAKYGGGILASSNSNTQSGVVSDNIFSSNIPQNVFDDDRTNGPNNQMVYNNNTFYGSGGTSALVYTNNLPGGNGGGAKTVSQLNSLVVTRANGSSTDKSTVDNTALSTAPVVGGLLAAPAGILQNGAPGDSTPPDGSYLTYAWSGGTAKLDGGTLTGGAGVTSTDAAGEHVLSIGADRFNASVGQLPLPASNFTASGAGPTYSLNWSVTSGTFLEAIIDYASFSTTNSSGSISVTPPTSDQSYYFYAITKEGGTVALASTGTPTLTAPDSITILVGLNLPDNRASIQIANSGGGTLNWTAISNTPNLIQVETPSGQTTGLASVVFSINPSGLAPGASQGSIEINAGAAGSKTVVIDLVVVNNLKRTFYPLILR